MAFQSMLLSLNKFSKYMQFSKYVLEGLTFIVEIR